MRKLICLLVVLAVSTPLSSQCGERSRKKAPSDPSKFQFLQSFKKSGHGQKASRTARKSPKARVARAPQKAKAARMARQAAPAAQAGRLRDSGAGYQRPKNSKPEARKPNQRSS